MCSSRNRRSQPKQQNLLNRSKDTQDQFSIAVGLRQTKDFGYGPDGQEETDTPDTLTMFGPSHRSLLKTHDHLKTLQSSLE